MKKVIYLSTAALLIFFPSITNAQSDSDLTPSEVFCINTSAQSGNAIAEINKMVTSKSNNLSMNEEQILIQMTEILDSEDTVQSVCSPAEF